jgi:hypothetical protein
VGTQSLHRHALGLADVAPATQPRCDRGIHHVQMPGSVRSPVCLRLRSLRLALSDASTNVSLVPLCLRSRRHVSCDGQSTSLKESPMRSALGKRWAAVAQRRRWSSPFSPSRAQVRARDRLARADQLARPRVASTLATPMLVSRRSQRDRSPVRPLRYRVRRRQAAGRRSRQ